VKILSYLVEQSLQSPANTNFWNQQQVLYQSFWRFLLRLPHRRAAARHFQPPRSTWARNGEAHRTKAAARHLGRSQAEFWS